MMTSEQLAPRGKLVFAVGIGALLFVPVFKQLTGLPPYLGMLLGLGTLWILTDAIHYGDTNRQRLKVPQALSRIDTQGVLFFLGILLSVGRLVGCYPFELITVLPRAITTVLDQKLVTRRNCNCEKREYSENIVFFQECNDVFRCSIGKRLCLACALDWSQLKLIVCRGLRGSGYHYGKARAL